MKNKRAELNLLSDGIYFYISEELKKILPCDFENLLSSASIFDVIKKDYAVYIFPTNNNRPIKIRIK